MGKIAIITFDDSEDIAMESSILVGEEQFEEVKLGCRLYAFLARDRHRKMD